MLHFASAPQGRAPGKPETAWPARLIVLVVVALWGWLAPVVNGQETVVISEFLAHNTSGLMDEDGDFSDWIELYNSGTNSVDLGGWFLTDDATLLTKWMFPNTNLAANGFLIVFASGKDRAVTGAPLHTSFALSSAGEYLGLVHPDGSTIASAFAPQFPQQYADVSYGLAQDITVTTLIGSNAPVTVFVPTNGALGLSWTGTLFDDSSWTSGTNGVGYETTVPGFAVRVFKANVGVCSLAAAEGVIATPAQQAAVYLENKDVINYLNTGGPANFGNDSTFPGFTIGVDVDNFALEATAIITIPASGNWTFGINSDDGFSLSLGSFFMSYPNPRGPADTLQTFNFTAAGDHPLRLVFYECGGGSEVELFAAAGSFTAIGQTPSFRLVGDAADGGLAVRSLPIGTGSASSRGAIQTDVQAAMFNQNASAYIRLPFVLTNAAALRSLTLQMKYDDGFVAYLNGQEIARRNAPAAVQWNSTATIDRPQSLSLVYEDINLSDNLRLLQNGVNLLAIQGLNDSAASPDFLIAAQLVENKIVGTTNHYFATPTPGMPNGSGFLAFVADTKFSHHRGFYTTNFALVITTETPGATIVYTTNGSVPSLTNGFVYSGPIPVSGTTTLRAAAYQDGFEPSGVDTQTYIFVNDVIRQPEGVKPGPDWPAPRGRGTGLQTYDYGMDQTVVNSPAVNGTIRNDLQAIPTYSIVMSLYDLFDPATGFYANAGGDTLAWERPCSIELIYPDGSPGFHINGGIRIRGGYSRSPDNPKHGLRVFFRQEYGAASLKYPVFGPTGPGELVKFDIRTFQNYSWSFDGSPLFIGLRDQFSRDTQLAMGQAGTRGDFYHLYINGAYWGVYNTDERAEANFGAFYYGGDPADYDCIKVSPDDGYIIYATDGDMGAWTRLWMQATNGLASDAAYQKVQGNNPDGTPNLNYEVLLDVDNLIDYMLVIFYGGNLDAPISNFLGNLGPNNFFALRSRIERVGFRFTAHDSEHTLLDVNASRIGPFPAGDPVSGGGLLKSNPQYVFQQMWGNAEFRLRVADHAQKHFFNGGALTASRALTRFLTRSNEIYQSVNAESARWGNANHTPAFTRSVDWLTTMRYVAGTFMPQRVPIVINQLKSKGLYPNVAAPVFNQFGGSVPVDFALVITNLNSISTVWYTLDGSDPRQRGGGVSAGALAYAGPITFNGFRNFVRARVLSGTNWSALVEATFYTVQDFSKLLLTEIMYNPPSIGLVSGDEFEFLELKNAGGVDLDLSGLYFSAGITFTFTNGTRLGPGEFFVLGRDAARLQSKYPGLAVNGIYTGKLDNGGETVTLTHPLGTTLLSAQYNDAAPWPVAADGLGFSLVPRDPNANPNPSAASNWRASTLAGGSPGADDPPSSIAPILINEALTHPDGPPGDEIELYNPNASAADIGGWFLTDDRKAPKKFRIPDGTMIDAGSYLVFTEADFNATPGTNNSFGLSAQGEEVFLFSGDANTNLTGYSHGFSFGAAAAGVSFGRYVTSTGEEQFVAQIARTFGAANAGPKVGPLVVGQVMYHPLDLGGSVEDVTDEYVELLNITSSPVPLYDQDFPTNTWRLRGGADFNFPTNVTLPSGGSLVVVSFSPADPLALAAFRARYPLFANVPVYGAYGGKLINSGGTVGVYRPDQPVAGQVPYILVDEVQYQDSMPWPAAAGGAGAALARVNPSQYGNDPINWKAVTPLTLYAQPQNIVARPGTNATFAVSAIGTGALSYQWRFNGVDLVNATKPTLTIPFAQTNQAGVYAVMVTDLSTVGVSAPASLVLLLNPTIIQQPQNVTALLGDTVAFSVKVAGTQPFGYRWRYTLTNGLQKVVANFGQGMSTLTIPNVQFTNAGSYLVTVTNAGNLSPGVTSGTAVLTVLADSDGDRMPDLWEIAHGLDPNNPNDASLDSDQDGMTNLQEYIAGTDPQDPLSYLRIDAASLAGGGGVVLQFFAVSNKTYTVLYTDSLNRAPWTRLSDVGAARTNRTVALTNALPGVLGRYYRLATPTLP